MEFGVENRRKALAARMMTELKAGNEDTFFKLWHRNIPPALLSTEGELMALELELRVSPFSALPCFSCLEPSPAFPAWGSFHAWGSIRWGLRRSTCGALTISRPPPPQPRAGWTGSGPTCRAEGR